MTLDLGLSAKPRLPPFQLLTAYRKAADLAILNTLVSGAPGVEHDINEAFAKKDDYLLDFSFTPVHITVLDLYDPNDRERPSLEM